MVKVQWFGTGTSYGLEILHQCDKRVKIKSQKVLRAKPTFVEVTGEKLVGGRGSVFFISHEIIANPRTWNLKLNSKTSLH